MVMKRDKRAWHLGSLVMVMKQDEHTTHMTTWGFSNGHERDERAWQLGSNGHEAGRTHMAASEFSKVMKRDEWVVECKIVEQTLLTFRKSSCHNTISISGFSMKFSDSGSTRMTESLDNLIWHLICIASPKSAPRNVKMSQVP